MAQSHLGEVTNFRLINPYKRLKVAAIDLACIWDNLSALPFPDAASSGIKRAVVILVHTKLNSEPSLLPKKMLAINLFERQ